MTIRLPLDSDHNSPTQVRYLSEMQKRTDTSTAEIVTRAYRLVRTCGLYTAARYMYWCGVPFKVAMRVLTRPVAERRG